jgi:hypothetical protein
MVWQEYDEGLPPAEADIAQKAVKSPKIKRLSRQSYRLTDPKHIVGRFSTPDEIHLTYREGDRLPGGLKLLFECEHPLLSAHLPHTQVRREAIPMPNDVITIGHHMP